MRSDWYKGTAAASVLSNGERRQLKRFEIICRHFARLERVVHGEVQFELPTSTSSHAAVVEGTASAQGGRLAQLERQRLGLGDDPLDDMESVLDGMGIKIVGIQMPEASEIAGGFFFESEVGPCIMVNTSLSVEEQLVAAAHQYCHFLADYNPYLPRLCLCGAPKGGSPSEDRAAGFAGAFLLPTGSLASLMNGSGAVGTEEGDLEALGVYYGVPVWAVARRLMELGLDVPPVDFDPDSSGGLGGGGPARDLPRRLVQLALEARSLGLVSPLRMARLLQMDLPTSQKLYSYFTKNNDDSAD